MFVRRQNLLIRPQYAMMHPQLRLSRLLLIGVWACAIVSTPTVVAQESNYDELAAFFVEWRTFQKPPVANGVPDYSSAAMAAQHAALAGYQERLAAIDTSGWSIASRVDYHIVQAEMNGLDFDHRVLRPWARNPAFYRVLFPNPTDVPAREGPVIYSAIELWAYSFPLSDEDATTLTAHLEAVPPLLEQAQQNLTENTRDLWTASVRTMNQQRRNLDAFAERVRGTHAGLESAIEAAASATDAFRQWLEGEVPSKTDASGIGIDNYNWYLKHVHLVPYTWHELVTLMQRELVRAHAALRLEEHRNRDRPMLSRIADAETYDRLLNEAVTEYMAFLEEEDVISIRDFMDPALRARMGRFVPATGLRGFFSEVNYRDPVVMRTHHYHWFDLARMAEDPHSSPIRRVPLLYNIFDSRAEGVSTGFEEMMMHAGLFDNRPRARELIHIMLAQRAARSLGELYMHANQFTMQEARAYASKWTPRGWLPEDGGTIVGEQHFYLQQPFYGTSYVIGKIQVEKLLAEYALQQGDAFTLKQFMDEMDTMGVIPMSLIRWEMTGHTDEIQAMMSME